PGPLLDHVEFRTDVFVPVLPRGVRFSSRNRDESGTSSLSSESEQLLDSGAAVEDFIHVLLKKHRNRLVFLDSLVNLRIRAPVVSTDIQEIFRASISRQPLSHPAGRYQLVSLDQIRHESAHAFQHI